MPHLTLMEQGVKYRDQNTQRVPSPLMIEYNLDITGILHPFQLSMTAHLTRMEHGFKYWDQKAHNEMSSVFDQLGFQHPHMWSQHKLDFFEWIALRGLKKCISGSHQKQEEPIYDVVTTTVMGSHSLQLN